jgi:hypothetical protein
MTVEAKIKVITCWSLSDRIKKRTFTRRRSRPKVGLTRTAVIQRHQSEIVGQQRTAKGPHAKWAVLVTHLVRDEGVAGSHPAAPTTFLNLRSPTWPVMRNETRPVIPLNPFAALRRSNEKELREFARIKFESLSTAGAQAELAELHVVGHLETFPHVHIRNWRAHQRCLELTRVVTWVDF